jgi:hypothetical protein
MNQHLPGRSLAVLTLALALGALAGGCKKNTVSIQAFATCTMPDDCKFSGKCDTYLNATPRLDLAYAESMWLAVEVHNNMPNNADTESGRLNTHDAHFESYDLSYSGVTAAIDPATITGLSGSGGPAQQIIPAEGTAVIGFEPFPIHVVNAILSSGGAIPTGPDYDTVVVTVTFKGRLEDGSDWDVDYKIPVELCANCLSYTCTDPSQIPLSACPSMFQLPRGALTCTANPASCVTTGTYCGSDPNVTNGNADTLYVCTAAGSPPAAYTVCPTTCNNVAPQHCN